MRVFWFKVKVVNPKSGTDFICSCVRKDESCDEVDCKFHGHS